MKRPNEGKLFLRIRVGHIEDIKDHQADNENAQVEHDNIDVPVGVLEVVGQLKKV